MSERFERTQEWPSISVPILGCSEPLRNALGSTLKNGHAKWPLNLAVGLEIGNYPQFHKSATNSISSYFGEISFFPAGLFFFAEVFSPGIDSFFAVFLFLFLLFFASFFLLFF